MRRITLTEEERDIILAALLFADSENEGKTMDVIRLYDKIKQAVKIYRLPFPVFCGDLIAPKTFTAEEWAQAPACE